MPRIAPVIKTGEIDSRKYPSPPKKEKEARPRTTPMGTVAMAPEVDAIAMEEIETWTKMPPMDMIEALKFAEDILTIIIHQSGEKLPEDPVYVSVNGRGGYIKRGQKTMLARKYVWRLLLAQSDSVLQDTTAREEKEFNRLTKVPTARYPLSVLDDPSPKGALWLQEVSGNS